MIYSENIEHPKPLYVYVLPLILFEVFIAILFYLNPIFSVIPFLAVAAIIFFYYGFLDGPLIWILLMIIASGLDSWGRIGGGVTVFHLTWFLSLVSVIFYVLYNNNEKLVFKTPITNYGIIFLLYALFSLTYSPNPIDGFRLLGTSFALFLSFFVFLNFFKKVSSFKYVIFTLAGVNILLSLLTFYQLLFQNVLFFGTSTIATETGEKVWRATGTFEDPNVTATYLMVGIILSISIMLFSKEKILAKMFLLVSALISFLGIVATFSRSGWLSLIVGIFALLFFFKKKKNIIFTIFFIIMVGVVFILATPYGDFFTSRLFSVFDLMKDPSIRARIYMAVSSLWMFLDNPILGVGFRGYPKLYDFYIHPEAPQILLYVKESHTLWTTLLAELGIIGFTIVLFWFRRIFKDNLKLTKQIRHPFMKSVVIGTLAVFVALNVDLLFYGFLFPHFNLLWLVFGILYAVYIRKEIWMETT